MKTRHELALRRARKEVSRSPLRRGDRVLILDDRSINPAVGEALLREIIGGLPVAIKRAEKLTQGYNRVIVPSSLEDECVEFLQFILEKKPMAKYPKSAIKLLRSLKEGEIEAVARSKNIAKSAKPGKKGKKQEKCRERIMVDRLESRYPGYKFSLLNSRKEFEGL